MPFSVSNFVVNLDRNSLHTIWNSVQKTYTHYLSLDCCVISIQFGSIRLSAQRSISLTSCCTFDVTYHAPTSNFPACTWPTSWLQRLRELTRPTREWGPALAKHRRLVDYVPGFVIDPWETGTRKPDPKQGLENWGMVYSISTPDMKVRAMTRLTFWCSWACGMTECLVSTRIKRILVWNLLTKTFSSFWFGTSKPF